MKILALYPGLNPVFDEVIYALTPLAAHGVSVRVIASRLSALKSAVAGAEYEQFQNLEIFRVLPTLHDMSHNLDPSMERILQLVDEFQPDLLLVNSFHCQRLARRIRRHRAIPTVMRLESADPAILVQRRYSLGIAPLSRLLGTLRWRLAAAEVDAMMTNDPTDLPRLSRLGGNRGNVYYAGHCAQQPAGVTLSTERNRGEMIYIGSLIRHKNCDQWLTSVPAILEQTPVEQFTIIGRGASQYVVDRLKARYGQRISYLPGVTREEALNRLSAAFFAYTESSSGWGFLCDAWSTGTPVLCPQSTFKIVPGWTGMMPQSTTALVRTVQRLYDDTDYVETLRLGGYTRFHAEHSAAVVSKQYLQIFRDTYTQAIA